MASKSEQQFQERLHRKIMEVIRKREENKVSEIQLSDVHYVIKVDGEGTYSLSRPYTSTLTNKVDIISAHLPPHLQERDTSFTYTIHL